MRAGFAIMTLALGLMIPCVLAAPPNPLGAACRDATPVPTAMGPGQEATLRLALTATGTSFHGWICVFADGTLFGRATDHLEPSETLTLDTSAEARGYTVIFYAEGGGGFGIKELAANPEQCTPHESHAAMAATSIDNMTWLVTAHTLCARVVSGDAAQGDAPPPIVEPAPMSAAAPAPQFSPQAGLSIAGVVALVLLLWKLPFASLFSRITRPRVLQNPLRADLLELIQLEPAIHLGEICERLGRSRSTVSHHLHILRLHGLVIPAEVLGRQCWFEAAVPSPVQRGLAVSRRPEIRDIVEAIRTSPGIRQQDLGRMFRWGKVRLTRRVRLAEKAGLVVATRRGREKRLRIPDGAER